MGNSSSMDDHHHFICNLMDRGVCGKLDSYIKMFALKRFVSYNCYHHCIACSTLVAAAAAAKWYILRGGEDTSTNKKAF
jgi:hypothetical protein